MPKTREKQSRALITFEVSTLNTLLRYAMCSYVQKSGVANLHRLIDALDLKAYAANKDVQNRLKLIKYVTEARMTYGMKEYDTIRTYVVSTYPDSSDYISLLPEMNTLELPEISSVGKIVEERLQYIYLFQTKDELSELLKEFNKGGWSSYKNTIEELRGMLQNLLLNLSSVESNNGLIRKLNMSETNYNDLVEKIVKKMKMPTSVLQTGIRQLNAILSPGFQASRLYLILGLTGRFKSGTLLNIADQICKNNPQIKAVEDGMRKTVLFISNENSIEETYARLFDMYSDVDDDITKHTPEEVIEILKKNGHFNFTDSNGIAIEFRYYANMEMSTGDIYTIINEMAENGYKVIAVVLDYIARVKSVNNATEERFRLQDVAKELKSLATYYSIPVITAQQVNREGNGIIDAAMRDEKADLAKFLGTTAVSESYGLIYEADWVALVNLEKRRSDEQWFLTFNRLKIRGKQDPSAVTYFNHPFVDAKRIRLATDTDLENSLSVVSLATDLESIDQNDNRLMTFSNTMNNTPINSSVISNARHASNILETLDLSHAVVGKKSA